jgi:PAS domain S-box-containing protein
MDEPFNTLELAMDNSQLSFFENYMPHGHCYLWQPGILWTNVIADLLIAASYFSIPIALVMIVKKRNDVKFVGIFYLFSAFILLCGITHIFSIITIWNGFYGTHGILKAVTALVSLATAIGLFMSLEQIISIPSKNEVVRLEKEALNERMRRTEVELKRKSESIFRVSLELQPNGLIVVDKSGQIVIANHAVTTMFGYEAHELDGMPIETLLEPKTATIHAALVGKYIEDIKSDGFEDSQRVVKGMRKDRSKVLVQITLSPREVEGELLIFASIIDIEKASSEADYSLESTNRLKRAIYATNDGIWEWNLVTDEVWASPQTKELLHLNPQGQVTIDDFFESIDEEQQTIIRAQINTGIEKQQQIDSSFRVNTSDENELKWVRLRAECIYDQKQNPILISGTITNINELKTLENTLASQNQFLNGVLEKTLAAIYVFDFRLSQTTYINRQFTKVTGYELDDLIKVQNEGDYLQLIHPEDKELFQEHQKNILYSNRSQPFTLEYRLKHKSGHWIWCLSKDSAHEMDDKGEPATVLGTFVDISNLKERESRVDVFARDFATTFEQAAVGIAHVGLDGNWLKVNEKLCSIVGYSKEELLSKNFQEITHPDDLPEDLANIEDLVERRADNYSLEKRYLHADGHSVWVLLTVSIVRNHNGTNSHFISVAEDISTRKKAEHALAESNLALERFAYATSHDLQEPLRKICAFSERLSERLTTEFTGQDEALYELSRITDASSRMREMIKSLLSLSRYLTNKIEKRSITFSEILEVVKSDLSEILENTKCQITLISDGHVYVENNSFQQLLRNLFSNSISYTKPGVVPEIKVELENQGKNTCILITDNGIGIEPENFTNIFKPFFRARTEDHQGYGMGLAICRQIIVAHEGNIEVKESTSKGTTLIITIPVSDS